MIKDKTIIETAYDIIQEEKLPKPTSIKIRRSLMGTRRRTGTCIKQYNTNSFRIIIHGTKAKYVECPNGNLIDRKTRKKYKRVLGEELPFDVFIDTVAHEIAHLKFWKHDAQHKSYTNHIYKKLKSRLGNNCVEVK